MYSILNFVVGRKIVWYFTTYNKIEKTIVDLEWNETPNRALRCTGTINEKIRPKASKIFKEVQVFPHTRTAPSRRPRRKNCCVNILIVPKFGSQFFLYSKFRKVI
jgi:hypothetical protein